MTYLGQVHGTLAALARMRPRDRGRVVNVGSSLAYVGIPLQSPYCGAKFACRGFSESVRAELLHEGSNVTLSMVYLPALDTPQFDWCEAKLPRSPRPVPPTYAPETAADRIVAAALDGRRSEVLGAWNHLVLGATKVFPSILSHYAARTGVDAQLRDDEVPPDRPSNLWKPANDERDQGMRGSFDDETGGVLERDFLVTIPKSATDFAKAAVDFARGSIERITGRRALT